MNVLAIGLDDATYAALPTGLRVERASAATAVHAITHGELPSAILLTASDTFLPLVRRCSTVAPVTPILILSTAARCVEVRNALRFSPNIGREVHCVAIDEPDLQLRIEGFIRRGELRSAAARTSSALNSKLAAALPPLRGSAMVLDRLLEVAPIGIVVLDEHGAIRLVNQRAIALLGIDEVRAVGAKLADHFDEADRGRVAQLLEGCAQETNPHASFDMRHAGEPRTVDATAASLSALANTGRYLVLLEDSTQRHALTRDLRDANRRKDEFLALLGHELRNPLAPIRAAVDLLGLRNVPAIERERAIIDRQLHHITQLVDDLLDISRITQGRVELQRERHDVAEIVDLAVEAIAPRVTDKRQTLEVDVPRGELFVDGDVTRLDQVFTNLLTNAIRYSEPNTVIHVAARAEQGRVRVSVRDAGRGIDAALLPHVFEMFVQAKQGIDRATGGLGLGLAIVRSLVELHGGTVAATSVLGAGSEFVVTLPLAGHASVATASAPAMPAASRVLIIDDNEEGALLLKDLLEVLGVEAHVAHTGEHGLALAETLLPSLVLLDLGLPTIDGFEVGRRMREMPALAHTRIVAVTGYGQAEDRARTKAAGFDDHLVKPLAMPALKAALAATK